MSRFAVPVMLLASPALADAEGYGRIMDWGHGYGFGMFLGPLLPLVALGLIILAAVWLFRRASGGTSGSRSASALAELDMRFARGEIDAEDYTARRKLLAP